MKFYSSFLKKSLSVLITTMLLAFSTQSLADNPPTTDKVEKTTTAIILADKVNLNTATVEQLSTLLSGIGEKKAEAIVAYREQHGAFTAIEQLKEVKGIGEAIFEKNKERLML